MPGQLSWEVRPRAGGGWEGTITLSMAAAGSPANVQVTHPGPTPGDALHAAVMGAEDIVGVMDEMGFFPALALLPQLLPLLSDVAMRVKAGVERATQVRGVADPTVVGWEALSGVEETLGDDALGFDFGDAFRAFGGVTQALAPIATAFAQRGQPMPQGGAYGPPQGYGAPPMPQGFAQPPGWPPAGPYQPGPPAQKFGPPSSYGAPAKQVEPWRAWS